MGGVLLGWKSKVMCCKVIAYNSVLCNYRWSLMAWISKTRLKTSTLLFLKNLLIDKLSNLHVDLHKIVLKYVILKVDTIYLYKNKHVSENIKNWSAFMSCPRKTLLHLKDTRETVLEIICRWITEVILFIRLKGSGNITYRTGEMYAVAVVIQ